MRTLPERGPQPGLHCLALPFLLHRSPFNQGITSSAEMGAAAAAAILAPLRPRLLLPEAGQDAA